jgi:purine-binding chemotaxis protein CheW
MPSDSTDSLTPTPPIPLPPEGTDAPIPDGAGFDDAGLDDEPARPRVLLVDIGAVPHAIPVAYAREVLRLTHLARQPGAPAVVRGLLNVRGRIVTVLALGDTPPAPDDGPRGGATASVVLLEHDGRVIGLEVDRVREVCDLDQLAEALGPEAAAVVQLDVPALMATHLLSS